MGKTGMFIVFAIVIALLFAGILYFVNNGAGGIISPSGSSSSTTQPLVLPAASGTTPTAGQTLSDGNVTYIVPADFGLATNQQQILVRSYIPACDPEFDYCFYYNGTAFQGTNFDSAGIRIQKRKDLTTVTTCLNTPPTGYSSYTPTSTTASDYSLSKFGPLGNAGAGHMAVGTLYRLAYNGACYEFETRIGQSQFANYPSGTIQQFTAADQSTLQAKIQSFFSNITLSSGEHVSFPQ